jgi:hypothetical protein
MRKLIAGLVLLLIVAGLTAGPYAFAQDEPATPETYVVDCPSPTIPASPDANAVGTVDPEVNATVETEMELAGMDASPKASPGIFVCASPEATPTS